MGDTLGIYVRGGCGIEEFHKRVIKWIPTHTPFKHPLGMCKVGIEEFSSIWTSLAPPELHWCVCKILIYMDMDSTNISSKKIVEIGKSRDWG